MAEYINKEATIKKLSENLTYMQTFGADRSIMLIEELPSADVIVPEDLLGWLLAYHTKSFELKGRYMPHEVISWLINDLSKNLIGERGESK